MLIRFVGDKNGDGPELMRLYGYEFARGGAPIEVANDAFGAKLAGNAHFQVVGEYVKIAVEKQPDLPIVREVIDIEKVKAPSKRRGRPPRGHVNQGSAS